MNILVSDVQSVVCMAEVLLSRTYTRK